MTSSQPNLDRWTFRLFWAGVGVAALSLLSITTWYIPSLEDSSFWNALIAFTILGIASDSSFLPNPRVSNARVGSSVVFIPFLASAMLFAPPWPMAIRSEERRVGKE